MFIQIAPISGSEPTVLSHLFQGMVDDVISKGKELSDLRDQITDYVTQSEDKTLETEQIAEKLQLVEEEYTIILQAVSSQQVLSVCLNVF